MWRRCAPLTLGPATQINNSAFVCPICFDHMEHWHSIIQHVRQDACHPLRSIPSQHRAHFGTTAKATIAGMMPNAHAGGSSPLAGIVSIAVLCLKRSLQVTMTVLMSMM